MSDQLALKAPLSILNLPAKLAANRCHSMYSQIGEIGKNPSNSLCGEHRPIQLNRPYARPLVSPGQCLGGPSWRRAASRRRRPRRPTSATVEPSRLGISVAISPCPWCSAVPSKRASIGPLLGLLGFSRLPRFPTLLGDFSPQKLPSRRLWGLRE